MSDKQLASLMLNKILEYQPDFVSIYQAYLWVIAENGLTWNLDEYLAGEKIVIAHIQQNFIHPQS